MNVRCRTSARRPGTATRPPWTVTIRQPLILDSELIDYYCLENEKDWVHMKNK
jgi:hypothetical protein